MCNFRITAQFAIFAVIFLAGCNSNAVKPLTESSKIIFEHMNAADKNEGIYAFTCVGILKENHVHCAVSGNGEKKVILYKYPEADQKKFGEFTLSAFSLKGEVKVSSSKGLSEDLLDKKAFTSIFTQSRVK